jgi:(E)-4-hydroxy-3-methylbut-2-enyl-diphosphate synthase
LTSVTAWPDAALAAAAARHAAMVALPTGTAPAAAVRAALERVAAYRRPVLLVAEVAQPVAAGWDTAVVADAAVQRVLGAAMVAAAAGCPDVVLAARSPETGLAVRTYRLLAARLAEIGEEFPVHLIACPVGGADELLLRASLLLGSLLCDGIGDSIELLSTGQAAEQELGDSQRARLAFNILQGAGARLSKTEFVACPSCGRTLFDLQETTERIQRKTGHLKGVKIAIMGCVVNGPGEMADADFGYVGGAPGKVNLYVGKECVEKGVPAAVADDRLVALIRAQGKWADPPG